MFSKSTVQISAMLSTPRGNTKNIWPEVEYSVGFEVLTAVVMIHKM
jgi:hypothetical protein